MEYIKGQFYEFRIGNNAHIFIHDGKCTQDFYFGFMVDIFASGVVNYGHGGATAIKLLYKPLNMNLIEFNDYLKSFNNVPKQVFALFALLYNRLNP